MDQTLPPPGYISGESKVDGIEIYLPAPQQEEENRPVVEFNCPQCGATTAYSIADGGLKCVHCGYLEKPKSVVAGKGAEEFEFTLETMERSALGWGETRQELECQNCGAKTTLKADIITHTCAFCGSNQVIQRVAAQDNLRPKFLIPFKVTPESCQIISRKWLGSSWMTPASLSQLANLNAFTPVYLPFWTFDSLTVASWRAEVGHTSTRRYYDAGSKTWRTRTTIEWRWESGDVRRKFDDLPIPGTTRLSALHLGRVRNFDIVDLVPYTPEYLAGFQALAYDIALEAAWETGRDEMREVTRKACRDQASTSLIRNFTMKLDFSQESWRYILLPIYVAAYKYAGKVYQVLVNGQKGSISGQRPVDWTKLWVVVAMICSPGLLLSLAGLITLPIAGAGVVIGGLGFVLLLIGLIISVVLLIRASRMDDA